MRIPNNFVSGVQLPASIGAALYTVPLNTTAQIAQLTVTNTTATARWFTLYLVPPSGTAGSTNTAVYQRVVGAGKSFPVPEAINRILLATGQINAIAEVASAITLMASGFEQTV